MDLGAAIELDAPSFTLAGTTTLTQKWGSGERWNVEDARGTGNYTREIHKLMQADYALGHRHDKPRRVELPAYKR